MRYGVSTRGSHSAARRRNRAPDPGPDLTLGQTSTLGAGLVDSCAGCHGRPHGSAGSGGNNFTRPDSRDAPHLFGLGLVEMLADEITGDLRAIRAQAISQAQNNDKPGSDRPDNDKPVTLDLVSKGINYGKIKAFPDGSVDTSMEPFLVKNIFADFKRHDLGPRFHERNFDGSSATEFMTEPLWGVGTTPPYGHDGFSINLREVILRHGGEAQHARNAFDRLNDSREWDLLEFLQSLVLFGPPDTASNLDPGNPSDTTFPVRGHGSIDLSVLFNDPADKE